MIFAALLSLNAILTQSPSQSVPPLGDRTVDVPGLVAEEVTLRIDEDGVPWIVADTMNAIYQGQGFMHGQDRFFQMDQMRRYAAGEIAALYGPPMSPVDAAQRPFLLRRVAERVLTEIPKDQFTALESYAAGVNAGLAALGAAPPEYVQLATLPQPWTPADSVLVMLAMGDQLNSSSIRREQHREYVLRNGSRELMEFLFTDVHEDDHPMQPEGPVELPPIPACASPSIQQEIGRGPAIELPLVPGSNAWVVSGDRTAHGGAILASDPHLGLSAPGPWYRVGLFAPEGTAAAWPAVGNEPSEAWWAFGLSLPGIPGVAIGTNGRVSWGFTNAEADTQDLISIEEDPFDPGRYRVGTDADGNGVFEPYIWQQETIEIKGDQPREESIRMTRWGPVFSVDGVTVPHVRKWTLTEPGGLDFGVFDVARARTTPEALQLLAAWAGPPQNALVADRDGRIGWTITGRFPERRGFDGLVPTYWMEGIGWDGWQGEDVRPLVVDPPSGVIYSANNRMASLDVARKLGRDWADPQRADRIATLLESGGAFTEAELAGMQLDIVVPHLEPLRRRLLEVIPVDDPDPAVKRARDHVAAWDGTAHKDQIGFRVLLLVDRQLADEMLAMLMPEGAAESISPNMSSMRRIIDERNADCLPPRFEDWNALDAATFRSVVRQLQAEQQEGGGLEMPWGVVNASEFTHPFSRGTPWGGDEWNLPRHAQSGHPSTVRVAHPRFGASARLVVGPGNEDKAILQTPGGQSGHYLSRHYRDLHDSWRNGEQTPMLPGPAVSTITLVRSEDS